MNSNQLLENDLKHIWHPCTQMKELVSNPPLIIHSAQGSYLNTNEGPLIDAISSWWCKSIGHRHPAVVSAIQNQLDQFEHVIGANTTHPTLVALGQKLAAISGKQHVFFASDGASAVEIALKLSLHAKQIQGQSQRREFIALQNSYHGETLGTMSVSDLGIFTKPYEGLGVQCHFLSSIPYVTGAQSPLWDNCEAIWPTILAQLEPLKDRCCALIVEPIIQGAGGMRCYSADFLARLTRWCQQQGIYVIADEIMTGIGRTGQWFASHHAAIAPDLICVSKGLSAGALPLSCVLIDHGIYNLFYDDYASGKSFLHSHTYSGNALAVAAALATLHVIEEENLLEQARVLGTQMQLAMQDIANKTQGLTQVRSVGAMVAADFTEVMPRQSMKRFEQLAQKHGALLRTLGQTIYWLPPLNTDKNTIVRLAEITLKSIHEL